MNRICSFFILFLSINNPAFVGNGITLADGTRATSNPAYSGTTECSVVQLTVYRLMVNMRSGRNKDRLDNS